MDILYRVEALYDAGRVKRLHTKHTVAAHTVAAHVYGSLVLAVELCTLNAVRWESVMLTLLYHDAAEVSTGDVPAPVKRENPMVSAAFRQMEEVWERRMELPLPNLTPLEQKLVKACDTLDLAFNVLHEREIGNNSPWTKQVLDNCVEYLKDQAEVVGVSQFVSYLISRSKEW